MHSESIHFPATSFSESTYTYHYPSVGVTEVKTACRKNCVLTPKNTKEESKARVTDTAWCVIVEIPTPTMAVFTPLPLPSPPAFVVRFVIDRHFDEGEVTS